MAKEKLTIKPKRARGEDGHKTFSVRVREDIVVRLSELSTQTGHSRNELVGILLEYALDNCEIKE